ncbi:MAG: heme exporter protein CcmB [Pirellulales bacterium]
MAAQLWWIVHKDLMCEWRGRQAWPAMLMLGTVVVFVFSLQIESLPQQKPALAGGLLWLAVFFAGVFALDRSFAAEREAGCWDGLKLYPVSPGVIYAGKLIVNIVGLFALEGVLVPLFAAVADIPLLQRPAALVLIAACGNAAIAAVGTLLAALAAGIRRSGSLTALLVLPMTVPVVLAAAEATRLMMAGELGPAWWRWIQFLAAFAVVFITAGILLFQLVVEE